MRVFVTLLLLLTWTTVCLAEDAVQQAKVTATTLRLRAEPNANSKVLGSLKKDEVVEVLEVNGDWTKIKTAKGLVGFCSSSYLEMMAAAPVEPQKESKKKSVMKGKVNATALRIRATGNANGKVLGQLKQDDVVTVLKVDGDWAEIETDSGIKGFASSKYLVLYEEASEAEPEYVEEAPVQETTPAEEPKVKAPKGKSNFNGSRVMQTLLLLGGAGVGYMGFSENTAAEEDYDLYDKAAKGSTEKADLWTQVEDHVSSRNMYYAVAGGAVGLSVLWYLMDGDRKTKVTVSPTLLDKETPALAINLRY